MTRPLAIFDIDGTLVDSRESIFLAATEAALALGLPEPEYDRVRKIVGLSLPEAMRTLEPQLTTPELDRFVEAFRQCFHRLYAEGHEEPLYPGATDLLRRLHRDGWRLSLATGQNRKGVARNLTRQGWAELFVSSHCADDGPGKPHPAMLHAALSAAACDPDAAIMIGDTTHDIVMALNAGVRPQGVAWGFHTPEEQIAAGAPHVAETFTDLEAALDRFAARAFA